MSRIDRLVPQHQLTIKVASLIGHTFSLDALRDSYPVEADKLRLGQHLQNLHRLNLTALETRKPNPTFAFRHAITQEVSYSLLPFSQHRQLHRAVAEFHDNRLGRFRGLKPYFDGFSRMCERRWQEPGSRTDTFLLNVVHTTINSLVKRLQSAT